MLLSYAECHFYRRQISLYFYMTPYCFYSISFMPITVLLLYIWRSFHSIKFTSFSICYHSYQYKISMTLIKHRVPGNTDCFYCLSPSGIAFGVYQGAVRAFKHLWPAACPRSHRWAWLLRLSVQDTWGCCFGGSLCAAYVDYISVGLYRWSLSQI